MKKTMRDSVGDFMAGKGFYIVLFLCVAAIGISGYYLFSGLFQQSGGFGQDAVSSVSGQVELEDKRLQIAQQTQVNADLRDAVDHSGDPARQADIARNELGLSGPGEKVIIFTD